MLICMRHDSLLFLQGERLLLRHVQLLRDFRDL
jgi:hypothetical protein